MKMYDNNFDPLEALQRLVEQNELQARQIAEMQHYLEEASKHINQHAKLIKQITEQNTEILLLWANTTGNFNNK
jgi:uncharacterized membrane-anchored protein YhcB (DUF1043 family)